MKRCALTVYLLCFTCSLFAGAGTSGMSFVAMPFAARPASMGGAFTAVADDASAMDWNPAGLFQLYSPEVSLTHQQWVTDVNVESLTAVYPLKEGTIGGSLRTLWMPPFDSTGGLAPKVSARDTALTVAYATVLDLNTYWGAGLKILTEELDGTASASLAADAGVLTRLGSGLMAGAAVQNLGTPVGYGGKADLLPLTLRGGLSWTYSAIPDTGFLAAVDLKYEPFENTAYVSLGGEFMPHPVLALRGGLQFNSRQQKDLTGLSAGTGFRYAGFVLDYAYLPFGGVGDNHLFTLAYTFGKRIKI